MSSRKSIALALAVALMAAAPACFAQSDEAPGVETGAPGTTDATAPIAGATSDPGPGVASAGSSNVNATKPESVTGSSMGTFSSTPDAPIGSAPATISSPASVTPPGVLGPVPASPPVGGVGPCLSGSIPYPC